MELTAEIERVEKKYTGYGDSKKYVGATITAKYESESTEEYEITIEVPLGAVVSYPTVGSLMHLSIGL